MDPIWVTVLIAIGIGLLVLGSTIRSRSLRAAERRRKAEHRADSGRVGWVLLWLLGVPLPILLVLYLLRGCT